MTRRDYILNTLANKLATQDNPDGTLKDDAPVRPADMTPADAESISPAPPMSLRDRISKHLGTAQGYVAGNPTISAAAGGGTLLALLSAVMSKKGKRLRSAGIGAGIGAAVGAGAVQGNKALKAHQQKKYTKDTVASILSKLGGKRPTGYDSLGTIPGLPALKEKAKPGPYKE